MYISAHILFVSCPAKLFIRWFITYNGVKHVAHKSLNHTHIARHPNLFERDYKLNVIQNASILEWNYVRLIITNAASNFAWVDITA